MKHGIFKIKILEDTWMSVTNVVEDQDDHVMRVAQFTIDTTLAARRLRLMPP